MSLSALLHPAKSHFPLADNAGNTTIELSATDATEVNRMRLAYGGSVRMLIYAPATVDNPTPAFETVLIDSAPTSNVFTVAAMTSEASYTTAREAAISFNLVADGGMEWFSTGAWTELSDPQYITKITESISGVQAVQIEGAGVGDAFLQNIKTVVGENYITSFIGKEIAGSCYLNITGYTGAPSLVLNSASWKKYLSCGKMIGTSTNLAFYANSDGTIGICDQLSLTQNLVDNGGFEASGSEKHDLSGSVTGLTVGKIYYFTQGTVGHDLSGCLATPLTADGTFVATATTGTISSGDASDSVKEVEGWSISNATLELDSSNERSGTYCAKVTASADSAYVSQDIAVVDGTWQTAAFHAKQSAAGHRFKFAIIGATTGTNYYSSSEYEDVANWVERSVTFKVSGDTSIQLRGYAESNTEIVYFDDWSLAPLCEKSATTETPSPEADHYKDGRW